MGFWVTLWRKPQWAYRLGGAAMLLGLALGWLGMWEKNDIQAKFGCVLGAAFFFALWSLLTCVGAMATYAAAAGQAFKEHAKAHEERLRSEDRASP